MFGTYDVIMAGASNYEEVFVLYHCEEWSKCCIYTYMYICDTLVYTSAKTVFNSIHILPNTFSVHAAVVSTASLNLLEVMRCWSGWEEVASRASLA